MTRTRFKNIRVRACQWFAMTALAWGSLSATAQAQQSSSAFELKDGDRVVFLGSELTEQEIKYNYLESALSAHWADRKIQFRNLGWAGDDPTAVARGYFGGAKEGYQRLIEEIDRLEPTVIFVAYGENGAAKGAEGLPEFLKSYERLIGDLKSRTKQIVIVSPPAAQNLGRPLPDPAQLNANRAVITGKLKEIAARENFFYVDVFTPLKTRLQQDRNPITYDTIRFTPEGYKAIAEISLQQLNVPASTLDKIDPTLSELVLRKNDLFFHRYRPQNETYLRGFRKHEQGQNSKEISEFDPLIERKEEQISAYLQGKPAPADIVLPEPAPLAFQPLSPEDQLKTFKMHDDLEIELFAGDEFAPNPIHMNFDSRGRLWVASSPIYPQLRPGAVPSDYIAILEDTDGDGVVDKKTIFADNLLIPTAILPDERGGAYVANSTELLYIVDTDGDGVSDERHVLMSGFGTEDTHHILHTFRWSPDSLLAFNQSIYIHSQLETPYGVQSMLGSGIWRYRKETARANTVMFGLVNPWGHIYDEYGQNFATDGAGGEGINYVFPGSAFLSAVGYDRILKGMNPGQPKHCGLEVVTGRHFPKEWQNVLIAADFRGNRVNRFQLSPQGSGYVSTQVDDLLSSSDRAFRPVDIKQGPDGALYIADWHDSIINHGEVDFRDPRRDDRHGRIWRVKVKDRDLLEKPEFDRSSIPELVKLLRSEEGFTRQMARVHLSARKADDVAKAVLAWAGSLPKDERYEQQRLEALWVLQGIDKIPAKFIQNILNSSDYRARAAAVRALSQASHEEFGLLQELNVLQALTKAVEDDHPQVRLEAVNALRDLGTKESALAAFKALDREVDSNIDFALYITARALQNQWLPVLNDQNSALAKSFDKSLFVLKAIDNASALKPLIGMVVQNKVPADRLVDVLNTIQKFAGAEDVKVLFDRALATPAEREHLLNAIVAATQRGKLVPSGDLSGLKKLLSEPQALRLVGLWNQKDLEPMLLDIVRSDAQPTPVRHGAVDGILGFGDVESLSTLASEATLALPFRRLATINLISLNLDLAAAKAADLLSAATEDQAGEMGYILDAFIANQTGPAALGKALAEKKVLPQIATVGIRKTGVVGERAAPLVDALRTASGLVAVPTELSVEEMTALLEQVATQGDPARGQEIYRRQELACITCHSIGGAGGLVGPDMLSLGASSPADYIVDSLINPSSKIKEGYHTVSVVTEDGKVHTGIMVREGADDLVLRDAQNKEFSIPKSEIEDQVISPTSMMPADLTAKLPRDEFVDLVAFLTKLGQEGDYKVPTNRYVRLWKNADHSEVTSRVNGTFAVPEIQQPEGSSRTASFKVNVTTAGKIGFKPNDLLGLYLALEDGNQNLLSEDPVTVLDLPVGVHTLHLSMFVHRTSPVALEIVDVEGSEGRAEPVNR